MWHQCPVRGVDFSSSSLWPRGDAVDGQEVLHLYGTLGSCDDRSESRRGTYALDLAADDHRRDVHRQLVGFGKGGLAGSGNRSRHAAVPALRLDVMADAWRRSARLNYVVYYYVNWAVFTGSPLVGTHRVGVLNVLTCRVERNQRAKGWGSVGPVALVQWCCVLLVGNERA